MPNLTALTWTLLTLMNILNKVEISLTRSQYFNRIV